MLLSALLDGINLLSKYTDREVNAVSNDSRNIKNGDVFVKELTDEEMPWAYAQFGLQQQ